MKITPHVLACSAVFLTGCVVSTDHHYPKLATEQPAPTSQTDIFNPLTAAEFESVKARIDHLQPYTTPKECFTILGLPVREYPTSVWGPHEQQSVSMMLRADHVLLLVYNGRGYVIAAQLDDKKWEWKEDEKKP
jgi:hypothetical protein